MTKTPALDAESYREPRIVKNKRKHWSLHALLVLTIIVLGNHVLFNYLSSREQGILVPANAVQIQSRCQNLRLLPSPPTSFYDRIISDRFDPSTRPTLIRNATIWTGQDNGLDIIKGDILLDGGIIKGIGHISRNQLKSFQANLHVVDANGAWATPGIVDLHEHIGDNPSPELDGAIDDNSLKGIVQPWLRTLDALNTHDDSYRLSISGGVTTAIVLPGSANGIGGQGFPIKLRDTLERTPTSKLLEPPFTLNDSDSIDWTIPPRWRHMKHACGENPSGVYGNTRMDNMWAFREIYDKARQVKEEQDAYCEKALEGNWKGLRSFPEELQYEALVDVLRGRVKVHVHCYEAVDLDDIVRLTNEFKFPLAAFHHAHESYLVPSLLTKAYGHSPAVALFAANARYKREAYRGSEFAPRILAENDISVVMKSDHPVQNSRYLLYEAQQAHYYGLKANLALSSVTATPARIMGMDHRIGFIKEGYDADLVIWDSHPLSLGATPKQVFIDGIAQLEHAFVLEKPDSFQKVPKTPNFDREAKDTVKYDGLPPLELENSVSGTVIFVNVKSMTIRSSTSDSGVADLIQTQDGEPLKAVAIRGGKPVCTGLYHQCSSLTSDPEAVVVDLKGGAISPGLLSFGAPIGLEEIEAESSTSDGYVYDALSKGVPEIVGGDNAIIRAFDGLVFATRDAYLAYRSGVTVGVSSPKHRKFMSGLGTAFGLGSSHKLEKGALLQENTALHVSIGHMDKAPSISTQIATLRRLLLGKGEGEAGSIFADITLGKRTLVVYAQSADVIASIIRVKEEIEKKTKTSMRLTIAGAAEAHLLAKELGKAGVGVIVIPSRPFPYTWEYRRILPGPPLTHDNAISVLLENNVTVGIGVEESWCARNTRFDLAWVALESHKMTKNEALALASTNLERLLGLEENTSDYLADLVAYEGGDIFDYSSKAVGVLSPRKGVVDLF